MNRRQMCATFPSTFAVYEAFVKQAKIEQVVEEIGEDGKLLWIGQRQTVSSCISEVRPSSEKHHLFNHLLIERATSF